MKNTFSAIITAGGKGTRFNGDKMLALLNGKPLILHTLEKFHQSNYINEIILLVKKEDIQKYQKIINKKYYKVKIIPAYSERIVSVYYGAKIAKGKYVITHDGNRPLTPIYLINKVIEETIKHGAVMTAVPPTATVKYCHKDFVKKSLVRNKTWIAQTPQGFERKLILTAFKKAIDDKNFIPTDDSEFITKLGKKVKIICGDEINIKVTFPQDLIIAEQLLTFKKINMVKIGLGQDSHSFENKTTKPLVLGGVKLADNGGLRANSDGDVILHSLCNALSSAIGEDSLGTWADKMYLEKGIKDSKKYVGYIFQKVKKLDFIVENISVSVEAKKPRLSLDDIYKIKKRITQLLEVKITQIGITFTSGEGLTAFGKGEGIQVLSIVSLVKK